MRWSVTRWCIGIAVCAAAACGGSHDTSDGGVDAGDGRIVVAELRATANSNVDILFAVDDSPGGVELQTALGNAFPTFLNVLNAGLGGLPSVHIGVVSSDLGTRGSLDSTAGPTLGTTGSGGCAGDGKQGNLQTNGTTLVSGTFIADSRNTDGTRSVNYTGMMSDALRAMSSLGGGGCGFEQPLEAVKRALNNNPANAAFLRADASLAVIMLTDEDDCSFAHSTLLGGDTSTLGPLQSFRCTRFGVTCDVGGTTPDEMNTVGTKSNCHSNEASAYLTAVGPYATFLRGLKSDPSTIYFGAIVGPPEPVAVELRAPPASSTAVPALAHSCSGTSIAVADPAVRIAEVAAKLDHHSIASVCDGDDTAALTEAALQIRLLVGDSCLSRTLSMPLDCVVTEKTGASTTAIPACGTAMPCWQLMSDAQNCAAGDHQRFVIQRADAPAPDTVDTVRCRP